MLIEDTLSSLPVSFSCFSFVIPVLVQQRIEKISGGHWFVIVVKTHLVKWEVVYSTEKGNSLSLRNLLLNKALLGESLWRFMSERDRLERKVG